MISFEEEWKGRKTNPNNRRSAGPRNQWTVIYLKYRGDKRSYIFPQFDYLNFSRKKVETKLWYIYRVGQQSTGMELPRGRKNIGFQPEIKAQIRIIRIIDSLN